MMKLHPQSHVTLKFRGHLTNKKSYISTFTSPMAPKLIKVETQNEETTQRILFENSITWSRDESKTLYLNFHKA